MWWWDYSYPGTFRTLIFCTITELFVPFGPWIIRTVGGLFGTIFFVPSTNCAVRHYFCHRHHHHYYYITALLLTWTWCCVGWCCATTSLESHCCVQVICLACYDVAYVNVRERTDLSTDTESFAIYVDRIRVLSNERSVTDLAVIRHIVCFT